MTGTQEAGSNCSGFMKLKRALPLALLLLASFGCSRSIGRNVEVPDIPSAEEPAARSKLDVSVNVAEFKDVRDNIAGVDSDSGVSYTEPQGSVTGAVEEAVAQALGARGVLLGGDAPLTVWGEVRKWRSRVETTTISKIESEASLYVEVVDSSGTRRYSGTYHGSRTSQFPIASATDVRQSLGLAMAQAIDQMLDDEEFLNALWAR